MAVRATEASASRTSARSIMLPADSITMSPARLRLSPSRSNRGSGWPIRKMSALSSSARAATLPPSASSSARIITMTLFIFRFPRFR